MVSFIFFLVKLFLMKYLPSEMMACIFDCECFVLIHSKKSLFFLYIWLGPLEFMWYYFCHILLVTRPARFCWPLVKGVILWLIRRNTYRHFLTKPWFDKWFFNITMVLKQFAFRRNRTLSFEFWLFLRLMICCMTLSHDPV